MAAADNAAGIQGPAARVSPAPAGGFDLTVPVAVIGAGACGLVAALAAREAGAEVVVLERDAVPRGSTALSSGMIPAAGSKAQAAAGVADDPARFAADIMAKNGGRADRGIVALLAERSGPTVDWLTERWAVPLSLVTGFRYPGHSALRMHAPPGRTGAELVAALLAAAEAAQIPVVTSATVTTLFADDDGRVRGLAIARPDGRVETLGCAALVLACNGYGGNPGMVARHIPQMAGAMYFGHAGNRGDALAWGQALGAAAADLSGHQGHGSVAHPHGILITWALMSEGGIQVNRDGRRFANEHRGYSEAAADVLAQPGGIAWCILDARLHRLGMEFEDYRNAVAAGAVLSAPDIPALAGLTGLPADALGETLAACAAMAAGRATDPFGRDFTTRPPLAPPWHAVRVTGALFHTQGGLVVDRQGRVLRPDGTALPNLFAGGGAARGVSGPEAAGYLSGNGLLSAVVLGRVCGEAAAACARARAF
ncbi:MAG: fumarate reductase flavoprotein subunit [Paracoccaceae bacterium]|nr:MAG: fumarate reductase flavoprotein subunit [Paracoccaceae bacterium]